MDYQQAIDFLYPLHRFGIKPGLDRVRALLGIFGDPHRRLGRIVHIAGTNGKGTVASCTASIFTEAGFSTALFTSPHLVDFSERIRIDGVQIPPDRVAAYCERMKAAVLEIGATFFEVTTVMAMAYFADEGVDVSVIEAGMGGRLDATNVLDGDTVIITNIGLDHTDWLGSTLEAIADEKAGIIKSGSHLLTAVSGGQTLERIRQTAAANGALVRQAGTDLSWRVLDVRPGLLDLEVGNPGTASLRLQAPLTGSFHAANVTLAVMAARDAGISDKAIVRGVSGMLHTGYRGRLEPVSTRPMVMLDVSHNPDGMARTVDALREIRSSFDRLLVLIGVAADKDAAGMVQPLVDAGASSMVTVDLPTGRSLPSARLGDVCLRAGAPEVHISNSPEEGLELLCTQAGMEDLILITGSFYLVGVVAERKEWCRPQDDTPGVRNAFS